MNVLRQFLPERSSEDILAGRIRATLGGQEYILPVHSIRENRAWKALMQEHLNRIFGDFAALNSAGAILARVSTATDSQMELVRAYDSGNVLPDLEDVTEPELLKVTFAILAAAFPLLATAIDQLLDQPQLLALVMAEFRTSSEPTSSPPVPMAGRQRRSKAS